MDLSKEDLSPPSILLECLFYRYAHSKDERLRDKTLKEI